MESESHTNVYLPNISTFTSDVSAPWYTLVEPYPSGYTSLNQCGNPDCPCMATTISTSASPEQAP